MFPFLPISSSGGETGVRGQVSPAGVWRARRVSETDLGSRFGSSHLRPPPSFALKAPPHRVADEIVNHLTRDLGTSEEVKETLYSVLDMGSNARWRRLQRDDDPRSGILVLMSGGGLSKEPSGICPRG